LADQDVEGDVHGIAPSEQQAIENRSPVCIEVKKRSRTSPIWFSTCSTAAAAMERLFRLPFLRRDVLPAPKPLPAIAIHCYF
jgi:hypothetical protein